MVSSGGENDAAYGMAITYRFSSFHVMLSTRMMKWQVEMDASLVKLGSWFELAVSWKEATGLAVYLDKKFISRSAEFQKREMTVAAGSTTSLFMGRCSVKEEGQVSVNMETRSVTVYETTRETLVRQDEVIDGMCIIISDMCIEMLC